MGNYFNIYTGHIHKSKKKTTTQEDWYLYSCGYLKISRLAILTLKIKTMWSKRPKLNILDWMIILSASLMVVLLIYTFINNG